VRNLATLSHAFSYAVRDWGWMETNPVAKVSAHASYAGAGGTSRKTSEAAFWRV